MRCNVCGDAISQVFRHTILNKFECTYYYCDTCGLLQTEKPYWLDEAYSSAITEADTGLVQRNIHLSEILTPLLFFLFNRQSKFQDAGGGYGLLTRLMRDRGFDYYWSDKYCENLFARGFEATDAIGEFAAITAFEVMEHIHDPLGFIEEVMSNAKARTIIFSTELFAGVPPNPDDWWYYTFETGQHISFYQMRTLQAMADRLKLNFYSAGGFHVITELKINWLKISLLSHPKVLRILSYMSGRLMRPKMMSDHNEILGR